MYILPSQWWINVNDNSARAMGFHDHQQPLPSKIGIDLDRIRSDLGRVIDDSHVPQSRLRGLKVKEESYLFALSLSLSCSPVSAQRPAFRVERIRNFTDPTVKTDLVKFSMRTGVKDKEDIISRLLLKVDIPPAFALSIATLHFDKAVHRSANVLGVSRIGNLRSTQQVYIFPSRFL
jgi:hypothetical protein